MPDCRMPDKIALALHERQSIIWGQLLKRLPQQSPPMSHGQILHWYTMHTASAPRKSAQASLLMTEHYGSRKSCVRDLECARQRESCA